MEEFQKIFRGVCSQEVMSGQQGNGRQLMEGTYYAAGVRSQIAGRGAHVAILDDVMSEEDSISEAGQHDIIKEWYPAGLRTRIMPGRGYCHYQYPISLR